mgnify:CR=1 FL=1
MGSHVRRATTEDAAVLSLLNADVQKLHADALPPIFKQPSATTFPPTTVTKLMSDPNNHFFLAEDNGIGVGYAWAEISRRPENGAQFARNSILVHHISVQPAHQQNGHGERLVAAVKALAKAEKISTVTLDTWSFNRSAQTFFERQGFSPYNHRLWMEVM